jgi:acylphosphatase
MKKGLIIKVHGRVQGVFFRLAAKERSIQLGLAGMARNEADGSVILEVEGDEAALTAFVEWCRTGSEQAWVRRIEVAEGTVRGTSDFIIR